MTQDARIYIYIAAMNERQKAAFIECVEKIAAHGWVWHRSILDGSYQIVNGNGEMLGQGVTLQHAYESAEAAK